MSQQIITKENCAVVINIQSNAVWADLYVNARNGIQDASITNLRWEGKTVKGAIRWANKQLDRK